MPTIAQLGNGRAQFQTQIILFQTHCQRDLRAEVLTLQSDPHQGFSFPFPTYPRPQLGYPSQCLQTERKLCHLVFPTSTSELRNSPTILSEGPPTPSLPEVTQDPRTGPMSETGKLDQLETLGETLLLGGVPLRPTLPPTDSSLSTPHSLSSVSKPRIPVVLDPHSKPPWCLSLSICVSQHLSVVFHYVY